MARKPVAKKRAAKRAKDMKAPGRQGIAARAATKRSIAAKKKIAKKTKVGKAAVRKTVRKLTGRS